MAQGAIGNFPQPQSDRLDTVMLMIVAGLVVAAPVVMGAVAWWAQGAVVMAALLLLALWIAQAARQGRLVILKSWLWLFGIAFLALAVAQIIPMPDAWIERLSPGAAETRSGLPSEGAGGLRTLSMFPYGTWVETLRLLALLIVFMVVAHRLRTRRQALSLIGAIALVAVFECLYGFGEEFSGHRHIFWHRRDVYAGAVTGTYWNKNHFAGLLEMALPATLGLLLAVISGAARPAGARARVVALFSSAGSLAPALLGAVAVLMGLGICLSLSRAAIACTAIALTGFGLWVALSAKFRRYTPALLLLAAAVIVAVSFAGGESLVSRVEEGAGGRSASWADRLVLNRAGLQMAREFPLTGSGLGSFRHVFDRFQPPRFGDRIAEYLHNDWLQLACEAGIPGLAIVCAGAAIFLVGTIRAAARRRGPFNRWVSAGALCGVAAMLLHSLFDYNLLKVTSNGIVFVAVAGVAYAVARMPGDRASEDARRYFVIPLGPGQVRFLLFAPVLAVVIGFGVVPARMILADIELNQYYAASGARAPDAFFFFPLRAQPADLPSEHLARAAAQAHGDPRVESALALEAQRGAEESVMAEARSAAVLLAGTGPDAQAQADELAPLLARDIALQPSAERAALWWEAYRHLVSAMNRSPASAPLALRVEQSFCQARLAGSAEAQGCDVRAGAERALWLAPQKPYMLFGVGNLLLAQAAAERDMATKEELVRRAMNLFREAIAADPMYADKVYEIVAASNGGAAALLGVTPRNWPALMRLARRLRDAGRLEESLTCLDRAAELCDEEPAIERLSRWTLSAETDDSDETAADMLSRGGAVPDRETWLRRRMAVQRQRATLLGMLGRWDERSAAVASYRQAARESARPWLESARQHVANQRYQAALTQCGRALAEDWSNPDALLTAADAQLNLAATPGMAGGENALGLAMRLAAMEEPLSEEQLGRLLGLLGRVRCHTETERIEADFLKGAAAVLAGRAPEGIARLNALAERQDETALSWRQRHMASYYLGLAHERLGQTDIAISDYARTLAILPTHLPAAERLAALGVAPPSRFARPDVSCRVDLGGRITFLGFSIRPVAPGVSGQGDGQVGWRVTCFWMPTSAIPAGTVAIARFLDATESILFSAHHVIRSGADVYPLDRARYGEIIADTQIVTYDLTRSSYLSAGIWTAPDPLMDGRRWLLSDIGGDMLQAPLSLNRAARQAGDLNMDGRQ